MIPEPESSALRSYLRPVGGRSSCSLARVELILAAKPHGSDALRAARDLLGGLDLIALDDELLDAAGMLPVARVRSLDAIHLTAARSLGSTLEVLVTYDARMASGAEALGIPVASPR